MRWKSSALAACALVGALGAGPAQAAEGKQTLYVKTRGTQLKASALPTARVLRTLKPGQKVQFEGRDARAPAWCRVQVDAGMAGYVYQANLSLRAPTLELTSQQPGKPLDPQAFASSGAAVKALGPGVLAYGKTLPEQKSVEQLEALETLAAGVEEKEAADYARAAGVVP
jgi:hypothetical protein